MLFCQLVFNIKAAAKANRSGNGLIINSIRLKNAIKTIRIERDFV
jgi:hypothetical protein